MGLRLFPKLVVILILIDFRNSNSCINPNIYCNTDTENRTYFINFDSFSQLILDCNQSYKISKTLIFIPNNQILIDKSYEIETLFDNKYINQIKIIQMHYVKGFDIQTMSFSNRFKLKNIVLGIYFSNLNSYSKGDLIESSKCNLAIFNNSNNFFNSYGTLKFSKVIYPANLCPLMFRNSPVIQMVFGDISNSFIVNNRLSFYPINGTDLNMLHFYFVSFQLSYERLTSVNFNRELFKHIEVLTLSGCLNGIQHDLFKEFKFLKFIDFQIDNFQQFFHTGNKWMNFVNFYVNANLSNQRSVEINIENNFILKFHYLKNILSFSPIYEYPNKDFCLFKTFPHERLVYPLLIPGKELKCTCTIHWLQRYTYIYKSLINDDISYQDNYQNAQHSFIFEINATYNYCNTFFNTSECEFEKKMNNCEIELTEIKFGLTNDTDFLFTIKWMQFILLTILQPVLCIIGIFTNTLTILVIKNTNKKKEFNKPMYQYIVINCLFNILLCVIMIFKLANTCIFYESSVFCSSIYQLNSIQYFKIILIHFLGNAVKMSSNVSYLAFSISRLLLISEHKEHTPPKKSSNLNFFLFFLSIFFVSCTLSIFRLFQYEVNFKKSFRKDFPFEIRNEDFCKNQNNQFECKLFNSFKLSNQFLNDIFCVFLNVFIDLFLLKKFKKHLHNKSSKIVSLDQHKNLQKSKKNINRMIFFNSFLYIFSHMPEFVSTLVLILFAKNISLFCDNNLSCDLINEEAQVFCLISIAFQFLIFRIFDKNFKVSFLELKQAGFLTIEKYFCN
jgi:hypothetical protein